MNITVHVLAHESDPALLWCLRHYASFPSTAINIHDLGGVAERVNAEPLLRHLVAAREMKILRSAGANDALMDDRVNQAIKNSCWHADRESDWAIIVDSDELLYFPAGIEATLRDYDARGLAAAKPRGFELFSESWPAEEEQAGVMLYHHARHAAPADYWYGKPILIALPRIIETDFAVGAHTLRIHLSDGSWCHIAQTHPATVAPEMWLLHCHHIGPIEDIARRYDERRARHAPIQTEKRWGCQTDGMTHAREKRAAILRDLVELFPQLNKQGQPRRSNNGNLSR